MTADSIKESIIKISEAKINPDSIIISKLPKATRIILLNIACCVPAIIINKEMGDITFEDISKFASQINHIH